MNLTSALGMRVLAMDACACDKKASDLKAKSKPATKKNVRRSIADNIKLGEEDGQESRDAIATALKKSHARARSQKTIASGGPGSGPHPSGLSDKHLNVLKTIADKAGQGWHTVSSGGSPRMQKIRDLVQSGHVEKNELAFKPGMVRVKPTEKGQAALKMSAGGLGSGRKPTDQDVATKARDFGYKHTGSKTSPHTGTVMHTLSHKDGSIINLSKGQWASHSPAVDGKTDVQSGSTIGALHDRLSNLHKN